MESKSEIESKCPECDKIIIHSLDMCEICKTPICTSCNELRMCQDCSKKRDNTNDNDMNNSGFNVVKRRDWIRYYIKYFKEKNGYGIPCRPTHPKAQDQEGYIISVHQNCNVLLVVFKVNGVMKSFAREISALKAMLRAANLNVDDNTKDDYIMANFYAEDGNTGAEILIGRKYNEECKWHPASSIILKSHRDIKNSPEDDDDEESPKKVIEKFRKPVLSKKKKGEEVLDMFDSDKDEIQQQSITEETKPKRKRKTPSTPLVDTDDSKLKKLKKDSSNEIISVLLTSLIDQNEKQTKIMTDLSRAFYKIHTDMAKTMDKMSNCIEILSSRYSKQYTPSKYKKNNYYNNNQQQYTPSSQEKSSKTENDEFVDS